MDYIFKTFLILCLIKVTTADPCTAYSALPDLPIRQVKHKLQVGETPLSDRYLKKGWYKADRSDMPRRAPELTSCGTTRPIWLADHLPPADGAEHNMTTCVKGFFGDCSQIIHIKVKNCGKFNVYFLCSTPSSQSAYCFNTKETADAPNVTVSNVVAKYSSVAWEKKGTRYIPYLVYQCTFKVIDDQQYCYSVNWYIDGTIVFENQEVTTGIAEIGEIDFLNKDLYAIQSTIHCQVGVTFCGKHEVSEFTRSTDFFIGIKILTPTILIERQGEGVIRFKPTVPFACGSVEGIVLPPCETYIQMINPPKDHCGDSISGSERCNNKIIGYDSTKFQEYYASRKWEKEYTMRVVHQALNNYSPANSRFLIRLESAGGSGNMAVWEKNVQLPDIKVNIYEQKKSDVWKGQFCSGVGDPHMKNFDGRRYDYQKGGSYIMYENKADKQQIQIKNVRCGNGIFCICGLAVRAGRDVFVLDLCRNPKIANFIQCDDQALTVLKTSEKSFKIILPSGTSIKATIRYKSVYLDIFVYRDEKDENKTFPCTHYFIILPSGTSIKATIRYKSVYLDIFVYPSVSDVLKTKGMCGYLDGISSNLDMLRRGKTTAFDTKGHPVHFTGSWAVSGNNNLFSYSDTVYESLTSLRDTKIKLCICDLNSKNKAAAGESNTITCRYERYAECDYYATNTRQMQCNVQIAAKRKRRDLRNHNIRFKRQASELDLDPPTNTLTENEARARCGRVMNASTMYVTCMDKVTDLDDSFLEACVLDLQYTGKSEYITSALDSALELCKTITGKNVTLQKEAPEIAEQIVTSICPNNCSENGVCINGSCTCNDGFGGLDCSFDINAAPLVQAVSDDGKCDRSDGPCDIVTLYGSNFLEDTNTTCRLQRFEIDPFGTVGTGENVEISGEQISLFEASCPLKVTMNVFAAKFKVSISNDGKVFTEEFDVHMFDSLCQEYDSGRDTYTLKSGFCFIEGKCYKDGQANPENICHTCNITDKGKFDWSLLPGYCFIDNQCFLDGNTNPKTACEKCNVTNKGPMLWSQNSNACSIDGECFNDGEVNPNNKCKVCNIMDAGKTKWSVDRSVCIINGVCSTDGDIDQNNPCNICDVKKNRTGWSLRSGFCYIDGVCLIDGQNNPLKPCLKCTLSTGSSTKWSHSTGFCFINDTCYFNNQVNPTDTCKTCYASSTEVADDWSLSRACDNSTTTETKDSTLSVVPTIRQTIASKTPITTTLPQQTREPMKVSSATTMSNTNEPTTPPAATTMPNTKEPKTPPAATTMSSSNESLTPSAATTMSSSNESLTPSAATTMSSSNESLTPSAATTMSSSNESLTPSAATTMSSSNESLTPSAATTMRQTKESTTHGNNSETGTPVESKQKSETASTTLLVGIIAAIVVIVAVVSIVIGRAVIIKQRSSNESLTPSAATTMSSSNESLTPSAATTMSSSNESLTPSAATTMSSSNESLTPSAATTMSSSNESLTPSAATTMSSSNESLTPSAATTMRQTKESTTHGNNSETGTPVESKQKSETASTTLLVGIIAAIVVIVAVVSIVIGRAVIIKQRRQKYSTGNSKPSEGNKEGIEFQMHSNPNTKFR